jgi:polar amino acid transport system substrate-binding protein
VAPDGRATGGRWGLRSLAVLAPIALGVLAHAGHGEPADPGPGVLRVCADPDNLPFSSSAAAGERGLYVDLAERVAVKLGVRTEYTWWYTLYGKRAVRNTLLADRCDAFFGLPHDADFMGRDLVLTRAFLDVGWAIIAPRQLAFTSLDDLKARRLGVVFRSMPQLLLAVRGGFQTVTFRTDELALDALGTGEIDAALVWGPTAGYHNLKKLGGTHRVVLLEGEGLQWRATVAVRKGHEALRDRIDGALAELATEIRRLADGYGFPHGPSISLEAEAATPPRVSAGAAVRPVDAAAVRPPAATDPDSIAAGRSLFNQHCSHCHAPNAMSPEPSRDLRRLRLRYGASRAEVFFATVTRGRPDKGMPPWNHLDPTSLQRVWAFLDSVQADP